MLSVEEANEVVSTRIIKFYRGNPLSEGEPICIKIGNAPEAFYAESNLAQFAAQGVEIQRPE